MRKKEISMIILAGGASSRMGRDKSDLTIDGKTFLEMQIEKGEKLDSPISAFRCKSSDTEPRRA